MKTRLFCCWYYGINQLEHVLFARSILVNAKKENRMFLCLCVHVLWILTPMFWMLYFLSQLRIDVWENYLLFDGWDCQSLCIHEIQLYPGDGAWIVISVAISHSLSSWVVPNYLYIYWLTVHSKHTHTHTGANNEIK